MTTQQLQIVVEFLESYADNQESKEPVEPWEWPETWGKRECKDFLIDMFWAGEARGSNSMTLVNPDTFRISNGEMARFLARKILEEQ